MDNALEACCDDFDRAISRLKLLSAHNALLLLRACLSAPKIMPILLCSPSSDHTQLLQFDLSLCRGLFVITNTDRIDIHWIQASIPVRAGELGVRHVAMLAYSTFMAFAASTRDLKSQLLLNCHPAPDPHVDSVIMLWTASHNIPLLDNTSAIKQHAWDAPVIVADKASLWSSLTNSHNRARLLAVSSSHSGYWLYALPMASCGTRLDNEAIRVAVWLCLGVNLCEPHMCPYGTLVDTKGSHGLSCKRSAGTSIHHHQLNDMIRQVLTLWTPGDG